jgi:hypothetical protein
MKNPAGLNHVKTHPEEFFTYLKNNRYPVFFRSPIFFRDFQYGLWRYLQANSVWFSYKKIEKIAREVIDAYETRGLVRKIDPMNYELQMPEFLTPPPATPEPATPAAKPAAAPAPPAPADGVPSAAVSATVDDKAAKLAELQAKMAAAKAAKEGVAALAPAASPAGGDVEKARKLAELQAKMAAAGAAREGGEPAATAAPATPQAPAAAQATPIPQAPSTAQAPASPASADDEKARKLAELKAKMEEARRKREAGE